jgi:hypothetical protein
MDVLVFVCIPLLHTSQPSRHKNAPKGERLTGE